ncbi:MAG: 2-hydroxyacyl-CoA dehydratase family protein [Pseudomonadota bacterium]
MMLNQFEKLISGIGAKLAEPGGVTPRRRFALELANLGKRLYDGEHPVAWCGVVAPFDLLGAMGYTSCFVEFIGASLASSGLVGAFLQRAEQDGLVPDMCAYHRAVAGAAAARMMPVPEVLVATTCPCTAGQATMENLARTMKRALIVLHVPQEDTPESVAYLVDQLQGMVTRIEGLTGRALDTDALARTIERSNEAVAVMDEVYTLAANVPSPTSSRELKDFGIVMPLILGRPEAIEVAEVYRDTFQRRVAAGTGNGVAEERVRLLWIQNRIQFKEPLVRELEEDLGAIIVVDELNNVTWDPIDPRDPLPGIARRMITNSFNGPIEARLKKLQDLARKYKVHGAINPCNWGCRQGAGARGMMRKGLGDVGVPVLNLEVDCVDPRSFSEGQLRTRLEAFVEMLEAKSSPN